MLHCTSVKGYTQSKISYTLNSRHARLFRTWHASPRLPLADRPRNSKGYTDRYTFRLSDFFTSPLSQSRQSSLVTPLSTLSRRHGNGLQGAATRRGKGQRHRDRLNSSLPSLSYRSFRTIVPQRTSVSALVLSAPPLIEEVAKHECVGLGLEYHQ